MAKEQEKTGFKDRFKQIGMAFRFTVKNDKPFLPLVIAAIVLPITVGVILAVTGVLAWPFAILSLLVSLMAMMLVLNWRTSKAVMGQAVGQPGAAYAIVDQMRGWHVTGAVAVSAQQDLVHRAVGKPGVVLLAEGGGGRVRSLLNQEKKKLGRVVGSTPIYDFVVGEGDNQLSVRQLRKTLIKLPRNITAKQSNDLDRRLTALKSASKPPMPKGPVPQNAKPPKGARKAMRGK